MQIIAPNEFPHLYQKIIGLISLKISLPNPSQFLELTSVLCKNLYLLLLLRFPLLYAARFDALRLSNQQTNHGSLHNFLPFLIIEWKMSNIASTFMLSTTMGIFQFSDAMTDPWTRTAGFLTMAFSSISILYGCICITRFTSSRGSSTEDEENRNVTATSVGHQIHELITMSNNADAKTSVWWNAWVLFASPAIWTTWSGISFTTGLLLVMWRMSAAMPILYSQGVTSQYIPGAAATAVLAIGVVYLTLMIRALRPW